MFIVVQKLKAVKAALKKWNTQVFGRTNERVIRAREQSCTSYNRRLSSNPSYSFC